MLARTFGFWRRLVHRQGMDTPAGTQTQQERRVWLRHPAHLETTLQPAGDGGRFAAQLRDISRGGANLVTARAFHPGDLITLELPDASGQAQSVLACIVRVNPCGSTEWEIGCIFSRELSDSDLSGFGARRQKHEGADQRTWMRFPCDVRAGYQIVGAPSPTRPAQVLNISASGVALLVAEQIETGALLTVELHAPAGDEARTILACVVHAALHNEHHWALGCNFIRELSEQDLEALVSQP